MSNQSHASPVANVKPRWQLYLELTRFIKAPVGTVLVAVPGLWSLTMCAYNRGIPAARLVEASLMSAGVNILRRAGACVWNDISRSKSRPVASGAVSVKEAFALFLALSVLEFAAFWFTGVKEFNLGLFSWIAVDGLYPLAKRWTYWPHAWLGVALAWSIPVYWTALSDTIDQQVVVPLTIASICFTVHFDTTYACQDRRDDVKAGIKSAAVLAGAHVHLLCTAFSATAVTCLAIAGSNNGQGFLFYTALVGGAIQLVWQIRTLDLNNEAICGRVAWSNGHLWLLLWVGMLGDYCWKTFL